MTTSLVLVLVILAVCGCVCIPVLRRLLSGPCAGEITQAWQESFSVDSYRPMEGLLNDEDFSFLSQQPGFDLSLYRKLRRERLEIFHLYLHKMIADFNRLHLIARLQLVRCGQDQSEALKKLVRLKVEFSLSVLQGEFNYHLCRLGLRTLPARHLICYLEQLAEIYSASTALAAA